MGQRRSLPVCDDLLDDGVAAVVGLGLQHLKRAGDEHRVVTPYVEQLALLAVGCRAQSLHPAYEQPAFGPQPLWFAREGHVRDLGDLSIGDQFSGVGVDERVRVMDRGPPVVRHGRDSGVHARVRPGGQTDIRPGPGRGRDHLGGVELRVPTHHDRSGAPGLAGDGQRLGHEHRRTAHVSGLALAQPDPGHHRAGYRGGQGRQQRVQRPGPLQPAHRRTLLGVAKDLPVGGIHIQERQRIRAGQQPRHPGQLGQHLPVHRMQLADMPVSERAEERAQGRRRSHLVEYEVGSRVPQPIGVGNTVRPSDHPGQQRHHLRGRVGPAAVRRSGDLHPVRDQIRQADPLCQRDHRHQPGINDQVRVVERDVDLRDGVRGLHLAGAPRSGRSDP